jgi:hypothetical protein
MKTIRKYWMATAIFAAMLVMVGAAGFAQGGPIQRFMAQFGFFQQYLGVGDGYSVHNSYKAYINGATYVNGTLTATAFAGALTGTGQLGLFSRTATQILTLVPSPAQAGNLIWDSTAKAICVSTGTAAGAWGLATSTGSVCN